MEEVTEKTCYKCKKTKKIEEFAKNKHILYERHLKYRRENVDKINAQHKEAYNRCKDAFFERQRKYNVSDKGKACFRRMNYKRKQWGFNPINESFDGAEFHHLHRDLEGNEDHEIGLFIPKELHRSVYHNWKSWVGMEAVNELALNWYKSQNN